MVTSDMHRAADLPSRCCLFNNCVQFTTFYIQRFTTVLRKMQTSTFLLLVIVMDSIKSNLSVNFVQGIQLPLFRTKIISVTVLQNENQPFTRVF